MKARERGGGFETMSRPENVGRVRGPRTRGGSSPSRGQDPGGVKRDETESRPRMGGGV